jgi:hypothetical protein
MITRPQRQKVVHRAKQIRGDGAVSALCFRGPRPIDLSRASWTTRDAAVTCKNCLRALKVYPVVRVQ